MGPTGSGKTFLSIALSKKYHINRYELDKIVYNQNSLGTHKSDEEINNDFEKNYQSKFLDNRRHRKSQIY